MSNQQIGLLIIFIGLLCIVGGALVWIGAFAWFGRLPGDIRIEGEHVKIYIPFASMLLLSLALSLLLGVINRLFR
ncbi:MAG TPA: DUF2905 domain-containing protein [Anaerolineae bacterium]|nr:DUF2905 domain-containing protein [Caldilineae bacterium]HID35004.1 DUF2905 domain-containing protein [Anaerolineae bacterium]